MTLCLCGCGQEVKERNKFIHGHNSRINNPMRSLYPPIFDLCWCGCGQIVYGGKRYINHHGGKLNKNKCHSEKSKKNISMGHLGQIPWNKGKKGLQVAWNKGLKNIFSEETIKKLSESHKGQIVWNKGLKCPNMSGNLNPAKRPEVRKKISETNKGKNNGMFGKYKELNPAWNGGTTNLPYPFEFNKELKDYIRYRDNYTCQKCKKVEEENNQKLTIHHIDYNKNNCNLNNLITLCNSCNSKSNINRIYWQEYFFNLLCNRLQLNRHFEGDL